MADLEPRQAPPAASPWAKAYFGTKRKNLEICGTVSWLARSSGGELLFMRNGCNLRWCPKCRWRSAKKQTNRIKSMTGHLRVMMLSIRSSDRPLSEQIEHLKKSFRRLRQMKSWKKYVNYGCGAVEVTFNNLSGQWHPHLHIIWNGSYYPQKLLSSMWCKATNGSTYVYVQKISGKKAMDYVSKYLTKCPPVQKWRDPEKRAQEIVGLVGVQLFISFGDWSDVKIEEVKKDRCELICPTNRLVECYKRGEPWAINLMVEIRSFFGDLMVADLIGGRDP